MPDAFCQGSFRGFQFSGWGRKKLIADRLAWVTPAPVLTPGSPLVAHAQGGLTLGPERGDLAADFWSLGDCEQIEICSSGQRGQICGQRRGFGI
jgi:hypothetical protein